MPEDLLANLEITPAEVKQQLDRGDKLFFVDVREPWEHQLCYIEGSKLIPLGQIPASLAEFESADSTVLFCHSGRRSLDAAAWLRSQGVSSARSMAGGIDRWSQEIDPRVPRY
ncbi:MAG TPA: rhodanese-like domain-containing protein [Candidatus Acidoferrales bacterium]|nr:rhodanese-like domain-containing protein [Candidatus Acidoferrales bacterium]